MSETQLVQSKVRQRRIALQKSLGLGQDVSREESKPFTEMAKIVALVSKEAHDKKQEIQEEKIEIVAEVLTDITADVKEELKKKKKKKLKELKKATSIQNQQRQDMAYELNVINQDGGNGSISPTYDAFSHQEDVELLPSRHRQKHGIDNDAWGIIESSSKIEHEFDEGTLPLYKKLSPLKCVQSEAESNQSPFRIARRQKLSAKPQERDLISLEDENKTASRKHRAKRKERKRSLQHLPVSSSSSLSAYSRDAATEEESFDFFTRVWTEDEAEDSEKVSSLPKVVHEIPDIIVTKETETETAILISRDIYGKDLDFGATTFTNPQHVPRRDRIAKENNVLIYPSNRAVPLNSKFPDGAEHHDMGEASSNSNIMKKTNINIMENRLITEKAFQWFGEDGCIKFLPNPSTDFLLDDFIFDETKAFQVVYTKPDLETSKQRLSEEKTYELELDLSSLMFTHHPLFSTENVVASRLLQMCEKFISFTQMNVIENLKLRLNNLRISLTKLKQAEKLKTAFSEVSSANLHLSITAYREEIRQTRKMRDMKEHEQQSLLKNIRSAWNELTQLRESQGFNSTSLNLEIIDEEQDEAKDFEEIEKDVGQALEDEKAEAEAQYQIHVQKYNAALSAWKQWSKIKKQSNKRHKRRQSHKDVDDVDDNVSDADDVDEDVPLQSPVEKPHPPVKFDAKKVYERLMENALKMRRCPGTPKTTIRIIFDLPITPTERCPKSEIQRRNDVSRSKLHFRIMFNNKKVSETTYMPLDPSFHCFWGQIFKLRIVHFPVSFKLEIYESGVAKTLKLAEVYVPVPDTTHISQSTSVTDHQFSSDEIVTGRHGAVGSGVLFNFFNGDRTWLLTTGSVRCSLAWGVADDGTVLAPQKAEENSSLLNAAKISHPKHFLYSGNIASLSQLREEIVKLQIDINDPSSIDVFNSVQEYRQEDISDSNDYFRLEPLKDSFEFGSMDDLENNHRFRLLQLRSSGPPEFRNYQMIPADNEDITVEMIQHMEAKQSASVSESDSVSHNRQVQQLRQKVREEVAKRFYNSQKQKTLEDVIIEEKVPNIGTLGFNILKLLQRKRPLYPVRKERKTVTGQVAVNTEVKIIVTVLHAINVPVRTDVDPVKERIQKKSSIIYNEDAFKSQVHPFVEVMFQRVSVKTSVADGPHPTWNQELILPFRATNGDFSPPNLERVTDVIYFNIFDEVTVDLLEDDKDRDSVVHQRLERRWLGSLKIPFTTLYLNSKIEGTFEVNVPPVLLGYKNEFQPWSLSGITDALSLRTHLSLFIIIEPCLQLPEVFREKCDSGEPEKILKEVERWQESVLPCYPNRLIKVMSVDLSGQWIFVSRFLRPISPPEELTRAGPNSLETWETLARFVSLIPTVADSIVFPGLCDIWSTSEQFLQMLVGDQEEHSMLLCNFFLQLGKKAMLLLGYGIPEGPTAYVITWEQEDVWLWNASNASHFSVRDSHSPLQRVGCIISPDNVWANIQKNDHPTRVCFDVSKTGNWKPFFHRGFPNPGLKSIQPASLVYTPTDQDYVKNLQETVKESLQENIMKWRRRSCTSWNNYCNQVLYKILTRLERNAGQTASADSLQELEQIFSSHKMCGFPISMHYTDMNAIVEAVYATGVHLTEDKNAEFSLAVYLHAYPCSVIAVWVYVAVLVSRRSLDIE